MKPPESFPSIHARVDLNEGGVESSHHQCFYLSLSVSVDSGLSRGFL